MLLVWSNTFVHTPSPTAWGKVCNKAGVSCRPWNFPSPPSAPPECGKLGLLPLIIPCPACPQLNWWEDSFLSGSAWCHVSLCSASKAFCMETVVAHWNSIYAYKNVNLRRCWWRISAVYQHFPRSTTNQIHWHKRLNIVKWHKGI